MGSFHLTKMSFRNLFKKPATKMYPVVAPTYTKMSKGNVSCDIKACTLCSLCEKRCPTHCISVDKPGETWTINNFACIQCYNCVRACPKDCLTMNPQYTAPATTMLAQTVKKPQLSPEERAAKEAKEKEKAAKVAAAMAARKAKATEETKA